MFCFDQNALRQKLAILIKYSFCFVFIVIKSDLEIFFSTSRSAKTVKVWHFHAFLDFSTSGNEKWFQRQIYC